jgi:hypothetical protein
VAHVFVHKPPRVIVTVPSVGQFDSAKLSQDGLHYGLKPSSLAAVADFLMYLADPHVHPAQ